MFVERVILNEIACCLIMFLPAYSCILRVCCFTPLLVSFDYKLQPDPNDTPQERSILPEKG